MLETSDGPDVRHSMICLSVELEDAGQEEQTSAAERLAAVELPKQLFQTAHPTDLRTHGTPSGTHPHSVLDRRTTSREAKFVPSRPARRLEKPI